MSLHRKSGYDQLDNIKDLRVISVYIECLREINFYIECLEKISSGLEHVRGSLLIFGVRRRCRGR